MVGNGGEIRCERPYPAMRQIAEYRVGLGPGVDLAARLVTVDGVLTEYALVLLCWDEGAWGTVRVFDNAHGGHEMHRYTRAGGKQSAELVHTASPSEAMNSAHSWIVGGWEEMVAAWKR